MRIVQERSFESGKDVVIDRYTESEENVISGDEVKEWFLEKLRSAAIVSVEHKRDAIPIVSFSKVGPALRGEETLTITFVPDEAVPDFKMTRKKERADRKAIGALVKEEPHAAK